MSLTPAGILLSQAKWLWFQYPVLEHNGKEVLGQGSEINSRILKLASFFKKQARVLKSVCLKKEKDKVQPFENFNISNLCKVKHISSFANSHLVHPFPATTNSAQLLAALQCSWPGGSLPCSTF